MQRAARDNWKKQGGRLPTLQTEGSDEVVQYINIASV
jgi:hypothetical protein